MQHRIDHVSVAVRDLNEAVERFTKLGFEVTPGGQLTRTGLRNALIRLGSQYIELLAVDSAAQASRVGLAGPALLDVLRTHEGGLLGYSVTSDHLDLLVTKESGLRGMTGLSLDAPLTMRRQVAGGSEVVWQTVLPGGTVWRRPWPALVEWQTPAADRERAEPSVQHTNGVSGIADVSLVVASFDTAMTVYRDALGFDDPVVDEVPALGARRATYQAGDGSISLLHATVEGQITEFLAEWGQGLYALTLFTHDLGAMRGALSQAGLAPGGEVGSSDAMVVPPEAVYGMRLSIEREPSAHGAQLAGV